MNLCLDYLFGEGYNRIDCSNRLESVLVADVRVIVPALPIAGPFPCKKTKDEVIRLQGLDQVTAFASRMDGFCHALARLGENVVPRVNSTVQIAPGMHAIDENRSHSIFKVYQRTVPWQVEERSSDDWSCIATFNDNFKL